MKRLQTLVWLRWRLWRNGLRSRARAIDTVVAVILVIFGAVLSLSLAAAFGLVLYIGLNSGETEGQRAALMIVFWVLAFLAVILPALFSLSHDQVPLRRLLAFPSSIGGIYRVSLAASFVSAAHFFWYPIMASVTAVAVLRYGFAVAEWFLVAVVFTVCVVVWCHTVLLLVQRLLRRRTMRELVALIGIVALVAASVVPALLSSNDGDPILDAVPVPKPLLSGVALVAQFLPPSLAVEAVIASDAGRWGRLWEGVAWIGVWAVVGVWIGYRILKGVLVDTEGAPSGSGRNTGRDRMIAKFLTLDRLTFLDPVCRGVAARDLRYLLRSTTGKFNIVIIPVFVIIVGLATRSLKGPVLGIDRSSVVFLGVMMYASVFSNNFVFNSFAWEGRGIRSYFMTPVTARQIVRGKNLGLWIYNTLLGIECVVCYLVIVGVPSLSVAISGCLAFGVGLLTATTAGNLVSVAMPVGRDISRTSNAPSQTGILVSFAMLIANVALIGGLALISGVVGSPWLLPFLLLLLAGGVAAAYLVLLQAAARLLEERKEFLVETAQIVI